MIFNFNGETYLKYSLFLQKKWGIRIISEFNFKGDEHILDLGCGDGLLTSMLADRVPNGFVLGIDASEGMIKTAKKIKKSNLKFELMDINNINFIEEFDLIFSNAALHWIKDHKRLLARVYNALKKEGILRFNFAAKGNCLNLIHVLKEVIELEEFSKYFKNFEWPWFMPDVEEYVDFLKSFNFKNVKVWKENADKFFKNRKEIIGWIEQPSIVPFLQHLPNKKIRKSFRNLVVKKMLKKTRQPNNTYFEVFRRINVFAVK